MQRGLGQFPAKDNQMNQPTPVFLPDRDLGRKSRRVAFFRFPDSFFKFLKREESQEPLLKIMQQTLYTKLSNIRAPEPKNKAPTLLRPA